LLWSWVWVTQAGSRTVDIFSVTRSQALVNQRAITAVGINWGRRGGSGRLSSDTSDESSREKGGGELHFEGIGLFDIKYV